MKRLALVCLLFVQAQPAFSYLKYGIDVDGRNITLKWNHKIQYFVNGGSVPGVSSADFQAAVARAFSTWEAVPTASVSYEFGGVTSARPLDEDGRSTLGFLATPELDRVLASTSILVDDATGEIVESDIFFNSTFAWSVSPAGESGRFDVESIALHEIGHLNGLGHSALGETELRPEGGRRVIAAETVMFPIAFVAGNISDRVLKPDDIAGISDIYPDGGFNSRTGSISGRVVRDGRGIFGAHVVAFDLKGGEMVGGLTLNEEGQFSIAGLSPGPHVIRVEPLDDADLDSFFDTGQVEVDLDFKVRFLDRLIVAPRGGDSGDFTVQVERK